MTMRHYLCGTLITLLCCCAVAYAQDEDVTGLINDYAAPWPVFKQSIATLIWSICYLPIYIGAVVGVLQYLQRFPGFDSDLLIWIGALWIGGMVINALAYAVPHHDKPVVAALIAMPFLFGWSYFISTRSFSDLLPAHAWKVALIVTLTCAPYFGTTWRILKPEPPAHGRHAIIQHNTHTAGTMDLLAG